MINLARTHGMRKTEAQEWVYSELDRTYPPVNKEDTVLSDNGVQNTQKADTVLGAASSALQRKEDSVLGKERLCGLHGRKGKRG